MSALGYPRLRDLPDANRAGGAVDGAPPRLLESVGELLDGSNSWEHVWGKLLVAGFQPQDIAAVLEWLKREGALDEREAGELATTAALAAQIRLLGRIALQEGMVAGSASPSLAGHELQVRLAKSEVSVFSTSEDAGGELCRPLELVGISKIRMHQLQELESAAFDAVTVTADTSLIVCTSSGKRSQLSEVVNRAAIANNVPAIYYHVQGLQVQLGPLVIPRQTACYACFKVRRDASLAPWERALLYSSDDTGRMGCSLGVDWLTIDVVKFITGVGEPVSRGRVLFMDYFTGLPEVHTVLRLPRCEICGIPRRPALRLWAGNA